MSRDSSFPEDRDSLYSHLLAAIAHKVRSILNNITVLISHSHTIYIDIALTNNLLITTICIIAYQYGRTTAVTEYSALTVLLYEFLII